MWFAAGAKLQSFEPASGTPLRALDLAAQAGIACDGTPLFQIAADRIHRERPTTRS